MTKTLEDYCAEKANLIVFDGECVLCSGFFRFMLTHDRHHRFSFATAQSALGQRLYTQLNLPTGDFQTNLVFVDGQVYENLDAFAAAMRALPGGWQILSWCRFLPGFIKTPLYRLIASNRYWFFGRSKVCLMPDTAIRARFATDGF
ncbi:thiol-disulfide oxidoreductase DCC family protein [Ruegeria sp. HKCCD7255]|uniref:thiol-disulfide oxidoreductase DCC family protein n=1 Tax=Ruegeria sp. HKCCD7255 TaxID=2683004 RepID=UPI0014876E41|nr:DCC1-like thiol-disulfide oxidoreductase family protein [Ruegeria sp. HKCCD7255]